MILLTGDWQAQFSTLGKCHTMLQEILGFITKYDIESVIHLGDMKEQFSPLDLRVLDFCIEAVKKISARCPMYILLGNHDKFGSTDAPGDFLHVLELAGATVITEPMVCEVAGVDWAFLPWSYSVERQQEWAVSLKKTGVPYLAFHAEVSGSMLNHSRAASGLSYKEIGAKDYKACFGGHLHRYQTVGRKLVYVGAPFGMDWNDVNSRKGHLLLKADGTTKRLLTKIPGYHDPSLKGFRQLEDWTGAHVRIYVPCDRSKDDVHAKLHLERKLAERNYDGAHIKTVPKFVDNPVPEIDEASDADALAKYVEQTYSKDDDLPSRKFALEVLEGYLGENTSARSRGRVQFLQAKAKNFLSFESLELEFTDGITLVRGDNKDWNGKSNGAGKTCLLQMIAVALFGSTFKRQKADRWTRRGSTSRAWVAVQMKLQHGRVCVVRRSRRPSKLQLFIDGKNVSVGRGVAGVQADIEQLTGLTMQTLANAVYIDQGTISEFLYGTDATRYKLLERFMNLERFDLALQKVKEDIKRVTKAHEEVYRVWLVRKDRIENAERELKTISDDAGDADSAVKEFDLVNAKFIRISTAAQKALTKLDEKIDTDTSEVKDLTGRTNIAIGRRAGLSQQIVDLKESIEDLDGKVCPVCKQSVTTDTVYDHLAEVREKIAERTDQVQDIERKITAAKLTRAGFVERIDVSTKRRVEWQQKVKHADQELSTARQNKSRAEWKRDNLSGHAKDITKLRKEQKVSTKVLASYDARHKLLRYCSTVFHRDGLPGFVGRLFYPRLNRAAASYSNMFTEGQIQVQFVETDDGVRPEITNVSGGENLEDQSEGERRLASIVTSFALRSAADPCNVLIFDEPGMGLDRGNAADFARALHENQDRFGSVLLVTHNEYIEAALQGVRTLVVTKQDKVSCI